VAHIFGKFMRQRGVPSAVIVRAYFKRQPSGRLDSELNVFGKFTRSGERQADAIAHI
jgi:hypothetical protein